MDPQTIEILRTLVSTATPLVIAAIGETITERAGVINLSLDGSLVLAAMTAFGIALLTAKADRRRFQAGWPSPLGAEEWAECPVPRVFPGSGHLPRCAGRIPDRGTRPRRRTATPAPCQRVLSV